MKRKLLAIIASISMVFGISTFSACDLTESLDKVLELEELTSKVEELEDYVEKLEVENATLKFEATFPQGVITENCIINKVERSVKEDSEEIDALSIEEAVEVTINGGKFDGGVTPLGGAGNTALFVNNAEAKVTINGGEFTIGGLAEGDSGHIDLIYCKQGTIEIKGGLFKGADESVWLLNCRDEFYTDGTAKIIVTGGTFVNWNPADCVSEGEHTSFVAEGYKVIKETIDGVDYYKVIEAPVEEPEPEVGNEY